MASQGFLRRLGMWTTVQRWREPMLYRVRLKGDLLLRLLAAFGVGAPVTALLLVLFAVNDNSPHAAYALFGMLFIGGMSYLILVHGQRTAGGSVRICHEGICRKRNYAALTSQWIEKSSWPYEHIEQCVIVPGQAIDQSFSLLFVSICRQWDMIGIPGRTDLLQLTQFLEGKGLPVQQGDFVPPEYTRSMNAPIAVVSGLIGSVLLVGGLGFYVLTVALRGGMVKAAPERPNVPRVMRRDVPAPARFNEPRGPAPAVAPPVAVAPPAAMPPLPDGLTIPNPPARPGGEPLSPAERADPKGAFDPVPNVPSPSRIPPGRAAQPAGLSGVAAGMRTDVAGGKGGFPFELTSPRGQPVVGFRYALGSWAGQQALAQLQPLYAPERAGPNVVVARDGYVVSGLEIDAGEFVHAVRIDFSRQTADGRVDPQDTYQSDWLGAPTNHPPKKRTAAPHSITGLHGRRGALIDALGIIVTPDGASK